MLWSAYKSETFDELLDCGGRPRTAAKPVSDYIEALGAGELRNRQGAATAEIRAAGSLSSSPTSTATSIANGRSTSSPR